MSVINTLNDVVANKSAHEANSRADVEVSTPDPTKYHTPDELSAHGLRQGKATMIPSANLDGTSPAVSIDSGNDETNVISLGRHITADVAAKYGDTSAMLKEAFQPLPNQPQSAPAPAPAPAPASSLTAEDKQWIAQMVASSTPHVNDVGSQTFGPTSQPQQQFTQQASPVKVKMPEPNPITGNVFESLKIPCITGVEPVKPTKQVIFDLGASGMVQTKQHAVIFSDGLTILVYDTRFEDGMQYMPPDQTRTGIAPIRLMFPGTEAADRYVISLGIQFSVGVLDLTVLPEFEGDYDDGEKRTNRQPDTGRTRFDPDEADKQGSYI